MNKSNLPYIAFIIGLILLLIVMQAESAAGETSFPLLTLLFMSEFGLILTAAGTFFGGRNLAQRGFEAKQALATVACGVLTVLLAIEGYGFWNYVKSGMQ